MLRKVIVGISGGVDSAVAALLLKEQGYDLSGVFMKNWSEQDEFGECTSAQDYEDARAACDVIGIPCHTVNFEKEYYDRVFKYFLAEYKLGRTPNPDVLCNSEIKFKAFLEFALKTGGELLATGHYARLDKQGEKILLKKGMDDSKDQSYFLCMLKKEQLSRAIFPLGGILKSEVRKIAKDYNLPIAKKKDSTGICFIGERNFRKFLKNYLPSIEGDIVTTDGVKMGTHLGLMYYTLGQRRGLNIGGHGTSERWFVVDKDMENNRLIVVQGDEQPLMSKALSCTDLNFINPAQENKFECSAKFRYRQPDQKVIINIEGDNAYVEFEKPQRAVTPGQFAVFYKEDICLGGGIIDKVFK